MWRFLLAAFLIQLRRLFLGLALILLLLYLILKLPIRHKAHPSAATRPTSCLALPTLHEPRFMNAACLLISPSKPSESISTAPSLKSSGCTGCGDFQWLQCPIHT